MSKYEGSISAIRNLLGNIQSNIRHYESRSDLDSEYRMGTLRDLRAVEAEYLEVIRVLSGPEIPEQKIPHKRDWVNCPTCGEPDMRREWYSENDGPYIHCVNLACPSNVMDDRDLKQKAPSEKEPDWTEFTEKVSVLEQRLSRAEEAIRGSDAVSDEHYDPPRCIHCASDNIAVFDSDNDLCGGCGRYFPAVLSGRNKPDPSRLGLDEVLKVVCPSDFTHWLKEADRMVKKHNTGSVGRLQPLSESAVDIAAEMVVQFSAHCRKELVKAANR